MGKPIERIALPALGRFGRFWETYEAPLMLGLIAIVAGIQVTAFDSWLKSFLPHP